MLYKSRYRSNENEKNNRGGCVLWCGFPIYILDGKLNFVILIAYKS